jgi:hypothetical protein
MVKSEIAVGRFQVGGMIIKSRVKVITARRLNTDKDIT